MRRDMHRGTTHAQRSTPSRTSSAGDQLTLLADREWRLDERTKEIGLRGLAEARAALQTTRRAGTSGPSRGSHAHAA